MDLKQLEISVNLHCLQPGFLNYELHYIIASDEKTFRFAQWDESPNSNEQRFYCFRMGKKLFIPAGNISLKESYVLMDKPVYPLLKLHSDFVPVIDNLGNGAVTKCIKAFLNEEMDIIKANLEQQYGAIEKHIVTSKEAQHVLLVLNNAEISISATMVYFRPKAPFSQSHYNDAKE